MLADLVDDKRHVAQIFQELTWKFAKVYRGPIRPMESSKLSYGHQIVYSMPKLMEQQHHLGVSKCTRASIGRTRVAR